MDVTLGKLSVKDSMEQEKENERLRGANTS